MFYAQSTMTVISETDRQTDRQTETQREGSLQDEETDRDVYNAKLAILS